MKQVSTESTDGSAKALASASENCSPLASDGSATGPWATSRPQLTHASAVSAPRASELPTTATRLPWGSGWCTTSWATSNIWWTFSTRMTPAWRSIASKASGRHPRLPGPVPGRDAVGGHPGLDDDDRLGGREPPGDARELARVAHRLEVEADGVGVRVVDPVLHEVVARDVDAVAGRGEDRDAEVAPGGRGEHRDSQGATLREQAEVARRWQLGRQGRVEPHLPVAVDDAEGVGTDDAHAGSAGRVQQPVLQLLALGPGLGEARRDDQQGLDPGLGAVLHDVEDLAGRHGHHREVDMVRDVGDPGVGRQPEHLHRLVVDGVDGAVERRAEDVGQDLVADGVAAGGWLR